MKYQAKAQKMTNEIRAYLIRCDTQLTPLIEFKLNILESLILDYLNAKYYINENGYITTFNKGTSIGLSPLIKLKFDSIKEIRKLLKEITPKEDTENVEDFIRSLTET